MEIGECIIRGDNVTTFGRIEYDAQMDNECHYVALASTDRWTPFALLIDHRFNQNQVLNPKLLYNSTNHSSIA